jgi:hypothetical protein
MYMLERESRRVRVTSVTITPVTPKRLKPHEVLPDAWNFSLEITAREKVAQ